MVTTLFRSDILLYCSLKLENHHEKHQKLSSSFRWAGLLNFSVMCLILQAIEGFALMVKRTAQTLQSFGTELAETELPNEIQATTILLSTHTSKRDKMKVIPLVDTRIGQLFFSRYTHDVSGLQMLSPVSVCIWRRTYWWLLDKAAGFWRASMSP